MTEFCPKHFRETHSCSNILIMLYMYLRKKETQHPFLVDFNDK